MGKTTHLHPRASEALQRAEEQRERRKAEHRQALDNPPRRGIDLATHQVAQGVFEVPHPQLRLGDINAEVNQRAHEHVAGPQVAGFQAVNRSNSEVAHGHGTAYTPSPTPDPQNGVNMPGTPGQPPTVRVTPPMGYFSLPPERPKTTRRSSASSQMMPMAPPPTPTPPTPVSQSVSSSQESSDASEDKPHSTFKQVTIHTAKCDVCNQHNKATLHRCAECGWQICTPCWDIRGGNGEHFPRRMFMGPTFGHTQAKKDKGKGKEDQKGPKTSQAPGVHIRGRTRSTRVQTQRRQAVRTPVQPAQRAQQTYFEPESAKGYESDETLSYIDNEFSRPPTRGKGKAMGSIEEDGDAAMSGMLPAPAHPDSEEQRRVNATIRPLMLDGQVPCGLPPVAVPPPQYYPQMPDMNRPAEDTHPNPTYRDLSVGAAVRFDTLLAAAEQVLGKGTCAAQATQESQYPQASNPSQTGPAVQTCTPAPVVQPPHVQTPMGPPPPPPTPHHPQAHPGYGQTDANHARSHPDIPPKQGPPQASSTTGPHSPPGAQRGIPAHAAATRRTLPAPENPDPLWTLEWFNTMAEHLTMLQRIGFGPLNREYTRLDVAPQDPAPEIPSNAVYERRYDQWLTPEVEARERAAVAILRGEVPISTIGVPGFAPAENGNGSAPVSPSNTVPAAPGASAPTYPPGHQNGASDDINVSHVDRPSATSIFGQGSTTGTGPDQNANVVIPARRPADASFDTSSHNLKLQSVETADGVEAVGVSTPQVPTPPTSADQASPVTQNPALGGHVNGDVVGVESGQTRAMRVASSTRVRGRAWEL